jgi:hypothetical protein
LLVRRLLEPFLQKPGLEAVQFRFLRAAKRHGGNGRHLETCFRFKPGRHSVSSHKFFQKIFRLRSAKAKNPRLTGNRGFWKMLWSLLDNRLHDAGAQAGAPQGNGSARAMRALTGLNCKRFIHSLWTLWPIPNNCQGRFRNNSVTFSILLEYFPPPRRPMVDGVKPWIL